MINEFFDINNETNFELKKYYDDFNTIYKEIRSLLKIEAELEVALTFVDAKMQVSLNKQYRNRDYVADVLTFALEDPDDAFDLPNDFVRHLGDIFICPEQAMRQAIVYDHSLRRELCFLFTHGMLHILGYDHIDSEEEKIMFAIQKQILHNLKIKRNK